MLKINKQLTDSSGGSVESGTIIDFQTLFPAKRAMKAEFSLFSYKSIAVYDAGDSPYRVKEIGNYAPSYKMTEQDYKDLTPLKVHERLAELIAEQSGGAIIVENIEIVI